MRRVLIVGALAIVAGFVTLALSLAAARAGQAHIYRANVGKTAFNATSGIELGKIVDVAQVNGVWVYTVNREGRIINPPVNNVVVKDAASSVAREAPAPSGKVDTSMQATAKEFSGRLVRTGGRLIELTSTGQKISARWTSTKCDNFEPDVIDLLLTVNRTVKTSPSIVGERACGGKTRSFTISGTRFQQYRTGKINDAQIISSLK